MIANMPATHQPPHVAPLRRRLRRSFPLMLGVWFLAAFISPAPACDVPVFRYALERWKPDLYHVFIFHRGKSDARTASLIEQLRGSAADPGAPLNLDVQSADLDKPLTAAAAQLWATQGNPELPRVVITFPSAGKHHGVAWAGPADPAAVEKVLRSPARREIASRLLNGDSIVWLFVNSGNKPHDDQTAARLTGILDQLQPKTQPEAPAPGEKPVGPPIRYSLLRVNRDDPAERPLVDMLLLTEDGLREMPEPIVFPVFGQGRVLYAVVGRGINEQNVREAVGYLTGACSCEIKAQNPGNDMLLAADWSKVRDGFNFSEDVPPPLTSLTDENTEPAQPAPVAGNTPPSPATQPSQAASPSQPTGVVEASQAELLAEMNRPRATSPLVRNVVFAGIFLLIASGLGALIVRHRQTRREGNA